MKELDLLNNLNIQSVIIEGGATTINHFINTDCWDEARVLTGNKYFTNGLKAPNLSMQPESNLYLGEDEITIFKKYMIEITLTIVTFSLMLIIFKYFEIFKVNNLQAIIVNYITAGVLALVADGSVLTNNFSITNLFQPTFIYYALIIGILFIITFNLIAFGTQKIGIAITTVSNKMSMIIPVLIGLFVFKEDKNF